MATALRVTVVGAAGRSDLLVPAWSRVEELATAYAEQVGARAAPVLRTPTGHPLPPESAVGEAVRDGDLVVAAPDAPAPAAGGFADRGPDAATVGAPVRLALAVVSALAAATCVALATGQASVPSWTRPAVVAVLLVAAVALVAGRADVRVRLAVPAIAAAAAAAAAWSAAPGGPLLGVAAAGLGAAVAAAVARIGLPAEHEDVGRTWLVVGAGVAAIAVVALLVGAGPVAVAAVLFGVAVSAVRLVPAAVVDVPDDVLLDLDRLAVTAWSAREQPQGGRRRHLVRPTMVRDVVRRSSRTVAAAVALAAALAALTAPVVVAGPAGATAWTRWGGLALVVSGGAFLALVGRGHRSPAVRIVLGLTALWSIALAMVELVRRLDGTGHWMAFATAALVAVPVLAAAVSLGRGWRSVWWARVGEILETLTGVLVVALLPLATGLFDTVRVAVGS